MSCPRYPKYKAAGLLGARVQVVADHLGEGRIVHLRGGDIGHIGSAGTIRSPARCSI